MILILLCAPLALSGCATYEPSPIDAQAHRQAWQARTPESEPVRAFIQQLSEQNQGNPPAFDVADGLSLAEAELVALVYNPGLRLSRLQAGITAVSAEQAGRWDDPEFELGLLRSLDGGSDPWIIGSGLAITIPISGRLHVEKARATAAHLTALDAVAEAEWRVRYELRLAWLAWSATSMRLQAQSQFIESIDPIAQQMRRLAEAGEVPRTESALFAIERSQREYELRQLRGELAEQEQGLRALMGLSPSAPLELMPSLSLALQSESDSEAQTNPVAALPERNPTLQRLSQAYEVAEQTLLREIRKQIPDLTIGPSYESDQGQSNIGLIGSIPIPLFNLNRQAIAEAQASRELARAEFETTYERLIGELAVVQARAAAIEDERAVVTEQTVPLIDRQLSDATRLLQIGETDSLIVLESFVRSHETKLHLIDLHLRQASTAAQLQYLVGPAQNPTQPAATATTGQAEEVSP